MAHDPSFVADIALLKHAVDLLNTQADAQAFESAFAALPDILPTQGTGEDNALQELAGVVLGGAQPLDLPTSFAHMDPPTPWLTWATTLWTARLNQNLLHPATAPAARAIEARVIDWLAPFFGMTGGHMVPGSTVANLTALWAARDMKDVRIVAAPDTAHISIPKAAKILGLDYRALPTDGIGRLIGHDLGDLSNTCLVLVAGSTSTGVIDPLGLAGQAAWTHVDAAWAGPLRLSDAHSNKLDGIQQADSVAVSAHKWLFQPKESALVFFKDADAAHAALSFGGAYLAAPNIGLLGSHGAMAVPLFAMLLAWGRQGFVERIDRCMAAADRFADFVADEPGLELLALPETGVVVWRPITQDVDTFAARLPSGLASRTKIDGEPWLRCVAANPLVDIEAVIGAVRHVKTA